VLTFQALVQRELEYARSKHPNTLDTPEEVERVVSAELAEFLAAAKGQSRRRRTAMLAELVSMAAMCQRAAEDMAIIHEYAIPFSAK